MFFLSLTNELGVECWNSYTNNYDRPVGIYVTNYLSVTLTNDEGLYFNTNFVVSGSLQISTVSNGWPGYNPAGNPILAPASFQIPLDKNVTAIPDSIYRFNDGNPYLTSNFELPYETNVIIDGSSYPSPHWWLMTTNNVQVIMVDEDSGRPIDYVQLSGPDSVRDLTAEISRNEDETNGSGFNDLWDTDLISSGIPIGMANQIAVSSGLYGLNNANTRGWGGADQTAIENEIDAFRAFYHYGPLYNNSGASQAIAAAEAARALQVPYTPIATAVQHISWEANDPLVHYLASDLTSVSSDDFLNRYISALTSENLGQLNRNYMPWGGNPLMPGFDANPYNPALKDPLVWRSDDWNFPTNESSMMNGLGQIHRGTPWQTIYLKASNILDQTNNLGADIGTNTWMTWTGDTNAVDAAAMAPEQDWQVASLLIPLFSTNTPQSLLSVNNSNPDKWQEVLAGLTVLTNDFPDSQIDLRQAPQFDSLAIASNSIQTIAIADVVQSARDKQPDGFFRDIGEILAVPQLSEQSPFLNWNDSVQQQYGISDEAYEEIPDQLLPLLRADSVGSVMSIEGQTRVRFTGYDGQAYLVQVSSNLVDWTDVSTNYPVNGAFSFTNPTPQNANPQFYRSVLIEPPGENNSGQ